MPDEATLTAMYGDGYSTAFVHDPGIDDPKEPTRVVRWLERLDCGKFVDYGCGDGQLLEGAKRHGWCPYGLELDPSVAERVERRTGFRVSSNPTDLLDRMQGPADVLHLGDVIEHLTDLDRQMPAILRLIKPGGVLLAQGPLEANPHLFLALLRLARSVRRRRPYKMPPYHVLLATAGGQSALFQRFGLEEIEYSIHEASWPAPNRLEVGDLRRARILALFLARRLSQCTSRLFPGKLGNRYFYAGRRRTELSCATADAVST